MNIINYCIKNRITLDDLIYIVYGSGYPRNVYKCIGYYVYDSELDCKYNIFDLLTFSDIKKYLKSRV